MNRAKTFQNFEVENTFNSYPLNFRKKLLFLRQLIFDTAQKINCVGSLEETLKWGEPSYLTSQTKCGTTIRLAWKKSRPNQYAIYFNCKTTLIDTFKEIYGDLFRYVDNRSIIFYEDDPIPLKQLSDCIAMALTYHLGKKFR